MAKNDVKKAQKNVAVGSEDALVAGSEAAHRKFLAEALKVPVNDVVPLRTDVALALHNAAEGVRWLADLSPADIKSLPRTDVAALKQIPELGLAVSYAHAKTTQHGGPSATPEMLKQGHALHRQLLSTLDALSVAGLIPTNEVDDVRAGTSGFKLGARLAAIPAVFKKHAAAIQGKHPVSAGQLKQAAQLGAALQLKIPPGRAKAGTAPADVKQAVQERDRLWTLLVQRHDQLWRAAAYLYGAAEVEKKVPSLFAHHGGVKKKAPQPAPAAPQGSR